MVAVFRATAWLRHWAGRVGQPISQLNAHSFAPRKPRLIGDGIVRRPLTEWTTTEHAERYLAGQDTIPHRTEGEAVLLAHIPRSARRILDLGTGNGRLIALLQLDRPDIHALGLDISRPMLAAARQQLAGEDQTTLLHHDMSNRLPDSGRFDAAVSCFAIHHLDDPRKRSLCGEVFKLLRPGGVFANLEHVASPSEPQLRRAPLPRPHVKPSRHRTSPIPRVTSTLSDASR